MPSIVNFNKLLAARTNLMAIFNQTPPVPRPEDTPEREFVDWFGTPILLVDGAFLGLDRAPKEFTEQGRQYAQMIFDQWVMYYKKWTQSVKLDEDSVKLLNAKMATWMRTVQSWLPAYAQAQSNAAGLMIANGESTPCYDGQNLYDTDHPGYYQGAPTQSNLLRWKFSKDAFWDAIRVFEGLMDPFSPGLYMNRVCTHVLYAKDIEEQVLTALLAGYISATENVALRSKNIKPVKWRQMPPGQFVLVDRRAGADAPCTGVYDSEIGAGLTAGLEGTTDMAAAEALRAGRLEWQESVDEDYWFEHRAIKIGTFGAYQIHAGQWTTSLKCTGETAFPGS